MLDSLTPELVESSPKLDAPQLPLPRLLFNEGMADKVSMLKRAIADLDLDPSIELELKFDIVALPRVILRKK